MRPLAKFLFPLLLLLALTSCSPGGAALNLSPSAASVKVGQEFTLTLQAQNVSDLMALEAHLQFDPAAMQVISLAPGGFLSPDFVVQEQFDNTAGTIDYALTQLNRAPVQGSGAVLIVTFRALVQGEQQITFRALPAAPAGAILADPQGGAISVNLQPARLSILP
jgi:hypothetical protein